MAVDGGIEFSTEEYKQYVDEYAKKYPIVPNELIQKIEDINKEINRLEAVFA